MSAARQDITVRHPEFDFSDLPDRWVGGRALATYFGNAGHVFIPLGEEFFIDTVKGFRDRVSDAEQRRAVRAFIGQEAVHKRAHEQLWDALRERGVPIDDYVRFVESVRSVERHLPATFRLAVTAALEHYTAAFGHSFLTEDLQAAVPDEMARLLAWHGLEELEHRAVAFDVLQLIDDRYSMRMAGFGFATGLFIVVPTVGAAMFALADRGRARPPRGCPGAVRGMSARFLRKMGRHLLDYLKPGFHPNQLAMPPQAGEWSASLAAATSAPSRAARA